MGKIGTDYKTNDLAVAAYLLMRGKKLLNTSIEPTSGKYVFLFEDSDDNARAMAIQFLSSECFIYDSYIRMLRGMMSNP